ncbi:MAG: phosphate signaling complex protein PhoU [Eubacteriales bacterium]|nr:phosphate signaling complex protein PhoU [Eubacteriales bacterium]
MRNHFDEQLELLNVELIRMGALCEDAISYASRTLMGEGDYSGDVYRTDREIDQKERDIENLCMRLLLQQQPVARDLRQVSSALKMISDMERIGDQASDIAEICSFIKSHEGLLDSKLHIRDMAEATMRMVTQSIDSYVKKDLNIAKEVILYDDVVDDLFGKVKQELIALLGSGSADEEMGEFCIDMLMIAKYFERIGDHATNIAEWVEFSITGTHFE